MVRHICFVSRPTLTASFRIFDLFGLMSQEMLRALDPLQSLLEFALFDQFFIAAHPLKVGTEVAMNSEKSILQKVRG